MPCNQEVVGLSQHPRPVSLRATLVVLVALALTACSGTPKKTVEESSEPEKPQYQALAKEQVAEVERARQAMENGQLETARDILQGLVNQNPEHPDVQANLGIVRKALGNEEAAKTHFSKALQASPGHAVAANNLALMKQKAGDFREARQLLEQAIERNPKADKLHYNLAVLCELYLMDLDKALTHYRRYQSLQSEPDPKVAGWITDLERRTN